VGPLRKLILAAVVLLAGCAPAPPPQVAAVSAPPGFPETMYREALAAGKPVFAVDGAHSEVVAYVYRGGPLARFGHDHVVSIRSLHGYALLPRDPAAVRADLYFPVEALVVDDPVLRSRAGFTTTPSEADIRGTRRNMLDSVLESSRYPHVVMHGSCAGDTPACSMLDARVTLHGTTRKLLIPVEFRRDEGRATVSGRVRLRLSDFGIKPFAILGGALRVEDEIALSFHLEARPASG
jgi:hypothetical protein